MNWFRNLTRGIISAIVITLLLAPIQATRAQGVSTITANGTMRVAGDDVHYLELTLTFPPGGGEVSGSVYDQRSEPNSDGTLCTATTQWTLRGTFDGGDGGEANGTTTGTLETGGSCNGNYPVFNYSGPWSGNFYASGTGTGVYDATVTAGSDTASGQFAWEVNYSAEEFNSALNPAITAEYIFSTYGFQVVDSPAGDIYGQKSWTPHELELMNEVFKELPPDLLKNVALTRIVRSQYDLDLNGNPNPNVMGLYARYGKTGTRDETGASATIQIFDAAGTPGDFPSDPSGDTSFKGSILHEVIHALQYRRDEYSIYDNAYKSPIIQSYMDATTPLNAVDTGIWEDGWTYFQSRGKGGGWKLLGDENNKSPTNYGKTNPLEDMCESVMMYVYDPQRLKDSSPLRYNFIRDQFFGGVEYDNGIRK